MRISSTSGRNRDTAETAILLVTATPPANADPREIAARSAPLLSSGCCAARPLSATGADRSRRPRRATGASSRRLMLRPSCGRARRGSARRPGEPGARSGTEAGNKRRAARVYPCWRRRQCAYVRGRQPARIVTRRGVRGRGAGVSRQPLSDRAAADAGAGRRGRSGAGDVSEGVSRRRPLRARHQPEGLAVHDPPQHGAEPRARSRPRRGDGRQRDGRSRGGRAAGRRRGAPSTRRRRCCCARRSPPSCRRRSTRCPTRSARRSGYATWKSFRTRKSPRC